MSVIFLLIGCGIAIFGFAAMRDPMRFALFSAFDPRTEGYYQRMVLDRPYRIQLRILAIVLSCFGLMLLTGVLQGLLKFKFVQILSDAFVGLLWLSFALSLIFGLVRAIVDGIRGRGADLMFGWYRMWKQSVELGPVAAFPSFEPRMDREKKLFTAIYILLVGSTLLVALLIATIS